MEVSRVESENSKWRLKFRERIQLSPLVVNFKIFIVFFFKVSIQQVGRKSSDAVLYNYFSLIAKA